MTQEKFNGMIMHLLVNIQTEVLTIKDFVLADIEGRNNHTTPEEKQKFIDDYDKMRKEYQNDILAQLRARYDDTLGSVDDLLKGL